MTLRELSIRGMARIAQTHVDTFTGWLDHRPPLTTPWCPVFSAEPTDEPVWEGE